MRRAAAGITVASVAGYPPTLLSRPPYRSAGSEDGDVNGCVGCRPTEWFHGENFREVSRRPLPGHDERPSVRSGLAPAGTAVRPGAGAADAAVDPAAEAGELR